MDPILYWNEVALEANRISHSEGAAAENTGPTMSSRALAIVHLAMHDAFFGAAPTAGINAYLVSPTPALPAGNNVEAAVAAAAFATLQELYPSQKKMFEQAVSKRPIPGPSAQVSSEFGRAVAIKIIDLLGIDAGRPGADDRGYFALGGRPHHRQDPDDVQGFHGPFYGATAPRVAVQSDHRLDRPPGLKADGSPELGKPDYLNALREVIARGGSPTIGTTKRSPDETAAGIFWAYDGANLLGTPPRLYNEIVAKIIGASNSPAQNARLYALVNAAMADAGVYSWWDKYTFDLWRPVLGVREHDASCGPHAVAGAPIAEPCDPFWLPLGAPRTNTPKKSFTPPFPAYPSGHATFGAAAFQILRRFLKERDGLTFKDDEPDNVAFSFVSGELDGKSDSLGTIRTRHDRKFDSLWEAIFENGASRVFLGVHWVFDAFAGSDVWKLDADGNPELDGRGLPKYQPPKNIRFAKNIGGVPLGLAIANDIYASGLKPSPAAIQPPGVQGAVAAAATPAAVQSKPLNLKPTNIR